MKKLAIAAMLCSLVSCASTKKVEYVVESIPSGGVVEVNGQALGKTPCTIFLFKNRRWVGVFNAPGGWDYSGTPNYAVVVYPPANLSEGELYSQTKLVNPAQLADERGFLFFDLRLRKVEPEQTIRIEN